MTKHEFTRQKLIDQVYEEIRKIKRFENFTRRDVEKTIKYFESGVYGEMLSGRGVMVRGQCSIYPDPGSIAVLKKKKMKINLNFYRKLGEKKKAGN